MLRYLCTTMLFLATICHVSTAAFLQVSGNEFRYNGEKVFLSGMNIAWHHFGMDFGNGRYDCCTGAALEEYLRKISENGGNSIRIWIHCTGYSTPAFNSGGYVTNTDGTGTMINDLSKFLDAAYRYDILVFPVLWSGATELHPNLRDLIWDDSKTTSYINNALKPMVRALRNKPALGGWEIMNEPEGLVYPGRADPNPCFDTTPLAGSGANWVGTWIPMYRLLRFINHQIAAIKDSDPKVLVTVGSWSERTQTGQFGYRDYYSDQCLRAAGGEQKGTIDFYQMHTYSWQGSYSGTSPMTRPNSVYSLNKPNVIGEFSQDGGDGRDITTMFEHAYNQGYSGAWSWQANGGGYHSDSYNTQARGLERIRHRCDVGGRVDIDVRTRKIQIYKERAPERLFGAK